MELEWLVQAVEQWLIMFGKFPALYAEKRGMGYTIKEILVTHAFFLKELRRLHPNWSFSNSAMTRAVTQALKRARKRWNDDIKYNRQRKLIKVQVNSILTMCRRIQHVSLKRPQPKWYIKAFVAADRSSDSSDSSSDEQECGESESSTHDASEEPSEEEDVVRRPAAASPGNATGVAQTVAPQIAERDSLLKDMQVILPDTGVPVAAKNRRLKRPASAINESEAQAPKRNLISKKLWLGSKRYLPPEQLSKVEATTTSKNCEPQTAPPEEGCQPTADADPPPAAPLPGTAFPWGLLFPDTFA